MLTMTVLDETELDEWRAFHLSNASKFVKERDPDQLAKAAVDQKLFVLRNLAREIRGTCGVFEYGNGKYREVGAVRVMDTGFGLQTTLMDAAVLSEWMFDPPQAEMLAITAMDNHASIKNIQRAGFTQVATLEPERLIAMKIDSLNPEKRYFKFYESSVDTASENISMILNNGGVKRDAVFLPITLQIPVIETLTF